MTSKLYHIICEWLRDLIDGTQWEGHVFAVGGCCRDEYMGFEIKDIDLAVDLPMGGVKFARWLSRRHLTSGYPTYFIRYGTAKLRLRRFPDNEIELVQTRKEQYTRETSRCPEVAFGTIEEDCYRRDFTVNSLYYDLTRRQTVDITGLGIPDMKAGLLRTPMDPDETFNDDPVRILRGLRFANRFGWKIDAPVFEAMMRHISRIDIVSRERVHSELCKMLNGPDPVAMMETLRQTDVLPMMVPQLAPLCADRNRWSEAMQRLGLVMHCRTDAPTRMRLASLFISLSPRAADAAKIAGTIMTVLRFDRPIVSDVVYLVRFAAVRADDVANPRYVRAMQNIAARPRRLKLLLDFLRALGRDASAVNLDKMNRKLENDGTSAYNIEQDESREKRPVAPRRRRSRRRHPRRK